MNTAAPAIPIRTRKATPSSAPLAGRPTSTLALPHAAVGTIFPATRTARPSRTADSGIELLQTGARSEILIHPGIGFLSSIGCINLCTSLPNASEGITYTGSRRRVIAMIENMRAFLGNDFPAVNGRAIPRARLTTLARDLTDALGQLALAATQRPVNQDDLLALRSVFARLDGLPQALSGARERIGAALAEIEGE